MILETIADKYLWFLVAILAVNLLQRKTVPLSNKKRIATLIIAVMALVWQIFIVIILQRGWPHYLAIVALFLTLAMAVPFRNRLFIFKLKCVECNNTLSFKEIINYDDNICLSCRTKNEAPQEIIVEKQESPFNPADAKSVDEIDWDEWDPKEVAVLCYIFEKNKVLLIEKLTGFGQGKVSAPGGHIEEGETASEAAIREVKEEVDLTVKDLVFKGTLEFQFSDGLSMRGYVFFTNSYAGEPKESIEARPFWADVDNLPYNRMWADDEHWLPVAMDGKTFKGRFIFDGEAMLSHSLEVKEDESE
jgi:8-oxo-dGTP diphosphatase